MSTFPPITRRQTLEDHSAQLKWPLVNQKISELYKYLSGLHTSLSGRYTPEEDFFSRYLWTQYHINSLHDLRGSPEFWIKWNQIGNKIYPEFCMLYRCRNKICGIYGKMKRDPSKKDFRRDSINVIDTDLNLLKNRFQDIRQHIYEANRLADIEKSPEGVADVRSAIESLTTTPVAPSWSEWFVQHQHTCKNIQSRIEALEYPPYLYVTENEETSSQKLNSLKIGKLQALFFRTLREIILKHYVAYVSHEYRSLYKEAESDLTQLEADRTKYYSTSTWKNWLSGNWEVDHEPQLISLHKKIFRLKSFYREYSGVQDSCSPEPKKLQKKFKEVFSSFSSTTDLLSHQFIAAIPEGWEEILHRGIPISCGKPKLEAALHLVLSEPALAKHIFEDPRQIECFRQFYKSYQDAQWKAQLVTLKNFIQTVDSSKPISFDQFIDKLNELYSAYLKNRCSSARPFYDLKREVANPTTLLSQLDQEKCPLFYTLIHQTMNTTGVAAEHETQESDLCFNCPDLVIPETLETLLEHQFNTPEEKTCFTSPPKFLLISLRRSSQSAGSLVGVQEQFFLTDNFTVLKKGALYELVSFTSSMRHYRKTNFGYTRIDNDKACVEDISQLDFLIAAQSCTDCMFRRSEDELSEEQLIQGAYNNCLYFLKIRFKICAIHSIHGRTDFKPELKKPPQDLVKFIQLISTSRFFVKRILENAFQKNPNDDLEQAFNKLPLELQKFLWKVWKSDDKTTVENKTSLLRDFRKNILLTPPDTLSIPPVGNERQYDQDRFVLTLMADRLVKYFEQHTENILENKEETSYLQLTLYSISEAVRAKRMHLIRCSGATEEAVHLLVTLAFSNFHFLAKGEDFLARQAISSVSRLVTVAADPLQENPRFQKIMRIGTTILLLGQSLDDPELLEEGVRDVGIRFFAHQGAALIPLESIHQSIKDLAIATLFAVRSRSPSPLLNCAVSEAFTQINKLLVDNLPPDTPQSSLNFYVARVFNSLSTNPAFQAYTTQKALDATLSLLSSIEASDPVLEDLTPIPIQLEEIVADAPLETQAQIDQLSKPNLIHNEYYIDKKNSFKVYDNQEFGGDNYGKFASIEEAQKFIHELQEIHLAENFRKLTLYDLKVKALQLGIPLKSLPDDPHFTSISLSLQVDNNSIKLYKGPSRVFKVSKGTVERGITEVREHAHIYNRENDTLLQSYEAAVQPLLPPHIMAPKPVQKAFPIIKHTNTVCTLTPSGELTTDRVTFKNLEQAKSVRSFHASHEVDTYTYQTTRFEMEKQAVQHGVPIKSLSGCGSFIQTKLQVKVHKGSHFSLRVNGKTAHTFKGSEAFTDLETQLLHYQTEDRGANQRTLNQYHTHLLTLTTDPITQTKISQTERIHILQSLLPPVKAEKEHGACFNGWRYAKIAGSKAVQWLRDIGLAEASVEVIQSGFNAPHTPHSTLNYVPYEPDHYVEPFPAQTASITIPGSNSSGAHSADTQLPPEGQQPFTPPTIDAPTFTPQNPFLPNHQVNPHQATLPLLPPSFISRQEIAARKAPPLSLEAPLLPPTSQVSAAAAVSPRFKKSSRPKMAGLVSEFPTSDQQKAILAVFTTDIAKSIPKGPIKILKGLLLLMIPDMSDIPGAEDPRKHFSRFCNNAIKKYDTLLAIKDPDSFEARSGEFLGELVGLGVLGRAIRVARTTVPIMAGEGAFFGAVMSEANETDRLAGPVFGLLGGAAVGKLLNRITPTPPISRISSRGLQSLKTTNNLSSYSDIKLVNRSIIKLELEPVKAGSELEWWKVACPRVDQIRNTHSDKSFYQALREEFSTKNLSESQIRRVLDYSGYKTYPRPNGLPNNCVVEFSDKGGGMIYRKWATIDAEHRVIRIMPGTERNNVVTAAINRRQMPYVVQERNNFKRTIDGSWTPDDRNKALTHIPLGSFKFKGW